MTGTNGIPRAFTPNQFRQEFNDFKREVAQQLSARTWVDLQRITVTEGGAIDNSVGDKLTETVKEKLVVDSENIGEGALNDKKIVGSSVRSEGVARAEYGDGTVRESNVSATLEQRVTPWSVGEKDTWPGLWLEGDPVDEPGFVPPDLPAGVTLGDAWGGVLVARSSRATQNAAYGEVFVAPGQVSINSFSAASGDPADHHRAQTQLYVGMGQFHLTSSDAAGNVGAEVRHSGDGVLHLKALNGVLVNGQPIGGGGGTVQHAEFTTSFSLPSTTAISRLAGVFTRDQGQDKNGGFASIANSGALALQPGVYAILYRADCGAQMGDVARLGLANATQTAEYTASAIKTGEWDGTLQHPNLYLPTAATVVFNIRQNSGLTRTCNIRVVIEKIK